jgi:carbon storage regulator
VLILTRKTQDRIYIGDDIVVTVTLVDRGKARIGVEAPAGVRVYRGEILPKSHPMHPDNERGAKS